MSWFNLNYIFGESSDTNTSTFISESSVHTICIRRSMLFLILTMGKEMMITRRRSCPAFIPIIMNRCCQTSTSLQIMKLVTVPRTDKKNMAITFSLVVP
ncbi:hypothetical protein Hanom_Chr12g01122021 [Helianthus anomalus]